MERNKALVFYVVLMIVVIVAMDIIFFRHKFRDRLTANVSVVLVFVVIYLIFLKRK